MENIVEDTPKRELPFNNLFLNSGAINGLNNAWMYFAGITATLLGYVLCQLIISFPLLNIALSNGLALSDLQENPGILFDADKIGINKNILLAMLLSMFAFALFGLYVVVKKIHHKAFITIITAYNKIRYKRFFFAFLVWGGLVITVTLASFIINPGEATLQFKPGSFFLLLIVSLLLMPIQTSSEEIIIRGYLMQGLAILFKNGIFPLIITSLLFGFLHMDNPEVKEYGWLVMLPYYSLFGAFLGMITLLDEGLELALGVHFANNLFSSLLITTPNGVLQTDAIFLVKAPDPTAEVILSIVMFVVTFF
ncbi:MAG: type II CAAX endopeptidase family protein, partial [Bacteroidia bacterium]